MKNLLLTSVFILAGVAAAQADPATPSSPVCLRTSNIADTTTPDNKTILFRMNDGSVWRNDLKNACPELRFNGFSYVATPPNEICGNQQIIRVLHVGSVCALGSFTQVKTSGHM